jgi:solute:Na+ symporter, SSS family
MTDQILIIISIILFLIVGFLSKNRKAKTIDSFSTRRNSLSWFVTAAGVSMTFVGGAALINMAALGYSFSWYTLVDPIALILGILIAVFFIKKYRADKGVTISQLLSSENKKLSIYIGVISTIIFLLIISAQFVAFSKLLLPYFPTINPTLLILIPSLIILLYVFLGGFSAVTNTDVLQMFFIFLFLLIPVAYFIVTNKLEISAETNNSNLFAPMPTELMILLSISLLFVPTSQDINIRAKSAKTNKEAKIGLIGGAIYYSLIVIACSFIGITLARHGVKLVDTEQAFPMFFKHFYPTIGIFAILAGMAAIWSTLDTYLVNGITSVAQDILKKTSYFKNFEERKLIIVSGIIVFILAMLAGIYFNQVLSLILTALLIYISVIVPIAFARWQKMNDNTIFIISLLTVLTIISIEVLKLKIDPKAIIYPVFGTILMLIGKYLTKPATN